MALKMPYEKRVKLFRRLSSGLFAPAAALAIKYGAMLVPVYGVRRPDGIHFDVVIEPPLPVGTPERMSQALNESI